MCTRWQQLGAFYPYSRNHNVRETKDQDPAAFSQASITSTINTLNIRYTILPYYYTLFYKAHTTGSLVARGLFQEFPLDPNCRTIDRQFLIGPAWLVTPVVEHGKRSVNAYFPAESKWYSYYDGSMGPKGFATLDSQLYFINLHVRGGYIIPTQKPANNTSFSRKNPYGLIIALDDYGMAKGDLFNDDGDSIDSIEKYKFYYSNFVFANNKLRMNIIVNNLSEMNHLTLDTIRIFGFANSNIAKIKADIKILDPKKKFSSH